MVKEEILNKITIEDLPNDKLKHLADVIGFDNILLILKEFSGVTLNIPNRLSRNFYIKYIKDNCHNNNVYKLAKDLDVGIQYVYRFKKTAKKGAK